MSQDFKCRFSDPSRDPRIEKPWDPAWMKEGCCSLCHKPRNFWRRDGWHLVCEGKAEDRKRCPFWQGRRAP